MSTETRDAFAQAICESTSAGKLFPWATLTERERDAWRRMAEAAMSVPGYAVIKLPTVAHKGPHDTDAMFFRQVADRFEHNPDSYVGGSNVRHAVSQLLRAAAAEAER
ncbi:hypothetical protein [Mycolicibacterium llatzerense]|uniref:Uncharacterized protein n=1 Tax=Mycolicibacterium llatzerense TaxID=280871 RepID=A0A0D1LAS1_9MYCO|nr:hypothetical protein [Mycolicibacterium llatzerense]KIU17895.1 hypothetical protein TL10_06470 [Mycolicibacterium llatzerense]